MFAEQREQAVHEGTRRGGACRQREHAVQQVERARALPQCLGAPVQFHVRLLQLPDACRQLLLEYRELSRVAPDLLGALGFLALAREPEVVQRAARAVAEAIQVEAAA